MEWTQLWPIAGRTQCRPVLQPSVPLPQIEHAAGQQEIDRRRFVEPWRQPEFSRNSQVNDDMVARFASLFPHERGALVAALRGDAGTLLLRTSTESTNADYYRFNHQLVIRLLEVPAPSIAITE